jgi:hypothetical protein
VNPRIFEAFTSAVTSANPNWREEFPMQLGQRSSGLAVGWCRRDDLADPGP